VETSTLATAKPSDPVGGCTQFRRKLASPRRRSLTACAIHLPRGYVENTLETISSVCMRRLNYGQGAFRRPADYHGNLSRNGITAPAETSSSIPNSIRRGPACWRSTERFTPLVLSLRQSPLHLLGHGLQRGQPRPNERFESGTKWERRRNLDVGFRSAADSSEHLLAGG